MTSSSLACSSSTAAGLSLHERPKVGRGVAVEALERAMPRRGGAETRRANWQRYGKSNGADNHEAKVEANKEATRMSTRNHLPHAVARRSKI